MIVFQFEESLQRGMSSLMLLALSVCFKRGLLGLLYLLESANKHLGCCALVRHVQDMGNAWTWQYMCPRFFFFLGEKWWTRLGHGLCYPKKKKTVTHFLSHQSPPTSFHTDLLCRQSSSHSNLFFFFFFFFSSIYFSFLVCPSALILVLFLFTIFFFFSCFTQSHV